VLEWVGSGGRGRSNDGGLLGVLRSSLQSGGHTGEEGWIEGAHPAEEKGRWKNEKLRPMKPTSPDPLSSTIY
jgi:hypothetical protein